MSVGHSETEVIPQTSNVDQNLRKARRQSCRLCREVGLCRAEPGFGVPMVVCMGLLSTHIDSHRQLMLDWEAHQLAAL